MSYLTAKSNKWFSKQSRQNISHNVAVLPVIARSNHSESSSREKVTENSDGKTLFIAGKTEIGGDEVVG